MSSIILSAASRRTTSTITRDGADLSGPRLITDDASVLCVRACRVADIATVTAGGALDTPGAYILAGALSADRMPSAYIGESNRLGRRLQEHAADPDKAFASELWALYDLDGRRIDKNDAVHLQLRLIDLVERAGVARLVNSANPCAARLKPARIPSLDKMLLDALPLLFDAGCRALSPAPRPVKHAAEANGPVTNGSDAPPLVRREQTVRRDVDDDDEDGPMLVGVTTTPIGVEEQALTYSDLWARGYDHQGHFVVAAGSQMRRVANDSANDHTKTRRQKLIDAHAFDEIADEDDRYRLRIAVAFPSRAIAAKVLCGAHVGSDKWRPLDAARPLIVAA